jgi:hypothetical protein
MKARSEINDSFAANVRPIIKEIQANGVTSMRRPRPDRSWHQHRSWVDWSDVQTAAILRRR